MAKPVDNEEKGESFDLDKFRKLLQLMEKFGVTEVNLQNDEESWKIRRGPKVTYAQPPFGAEFAQAPMMHGASQTSVAAAASAATAPTPAVPSGITINAPTVGTFYSASGPDEPPLVSVGTVVKPDTVICIIEAMKVFNSIMAEKSGRIVEILVENGDAVGFGQPLFRIEPA